MIIKTVIVDDHQLFAQGVKATLAKDPIIEVVAILSNGKELLSWLEYETCDVIVLDLDMPEMNGLDCLRALKERGKRIPTLIVSMKLHGVYFKKVKELGGKGYLAKNEEIDVLIRAIHSLNDGGEFFKNINHVQRGIKLTKTEMVVVSEICKGLSNKEIAAKHFRAVDTIATHRKNIYAKLSVTNTAELIGFAIKNGLVTDLD